MTREQKKEIGDKRALPPVLEVLTAPPSVSSYNGLHMTLSIRCLEVLRAGLSVLNTSILSTRSKFLTGLQLCNSQCIVVVIIVFKILNGALFKRHTMDEVYHPTDAFKFFINLPLYNYSHVEFVIFY